MNKIKRNFVFTLNIFIHFSILSINNRRHYFHPSFQSMIKNMKAFLINDNNNNENNKNIHRIMITKIQMIVLSLLYYHLSWPFSWKKKSDRYRKKNA